MGRFPKTAQDCCGGFPVPRNAPLPFKPVCAFPNTIFGIRGVEQRRRGEKRSFWPIMSTVIKQTSLKTRVSTSVFSTKEGHNVWGVTCWRIMTTCITNRHTHTAMASVWQDKACKKKKKKTKGEKKQTCMSAALRLVPPHIHGQSQQLPVKFEQKLCKVAIKKRKRKEN